MEKRISTAVSIVSHPLLMPTFAFAILVNIPVYFALVIPAEAKWQITGLVFISSAFLPAVFIYMLVRLKKVTSVYLQARDERNLPFIITVIFFYTTYFLVRKTGISPVYVYFMAGVTFLAFLTLVINLFWKISTHMIAMGGLTGMAVGISFFTGIYFLNLIIILVVASGIVGYARLKLGAHTPAEVYAGYSLGIITLVLMFTLL